jgi:hypothetical protein
MEITNSVEDIQSIRAKAFSYKENAFNNFKQSNKIKSNQLVLF